MLIRSTSHIVNSIIDPFTILKTNVLDQNLAYRTRFDCFKESLHWLLIWGTFVGWKYFRTLLSKFWRSRNPFKLQNSLSNSSFIWLQLVCSVLLVFHNNLCNGRKGQLPQACLIMLSSVWFWIRYFEMRELNYFWYKLEVAVIVKKFKSS